MCYLYICIYIYICIILCVCVIRICNDHILVTHTRETHTYVCIMYEHINITYRNYQHTHTSVYVHMRLYVHYMCVYMYCVCYDIYALADRSVLHSTARAIPFCFLLPAVTRPHHGCDCCRGRGRLHWAEA